jgi:uncharacterized membrane protein YraQ (UPF0718 family)
MNQPTGNQPAIRIHPVPALAGTLVAWILVFRLLVVFTDSLTFSVFHLSRRSRLGESISFFLYQVPRMLLVLALVIFIVGIIRSFFTPQRVRRILAGRSEPVGSVLASLLGIVTPFCTCSAVPLFLGLILGEMVMGSIWSLIGIVFNIPTYSFWGA